MRDSFLVEIYFESLRLVVEEKAWKLPEGCTGDDKQVAGALHDSGRSSRELNFEKKRRQIKVIMHYKTSCINNRTQNL